MRLLNKADFWLGIIVVLVGFYALSEGIDFDQYSRSYPLALAIFHIAIGLGLVAISIKDISDSKDSAKKLFNDMRGPLSVIFLLIIWGILINVNFGYFISSLILMPAVLFILGYHKIKQVLLGTVGIVGAVFVLFYVIFDVPLPLNPFIENLIG